MTNFRQFSGGGGAFSIYLHQPGPLLCHIDVVENLASGIQAVGKTRDVTTKESIIRNNDNRPPETGHRQGAFIGITGFAR